MATELKLRRGTTSQHSSFTGAEAEVTVDTDKETVVVHDGATTGGFAIAREDMSNVPSNSFSGDKLQDNSVAGDKIIDLAATEVTYDASTSGLDGTTAQAAIDDAVDSFVGRKKKIAQGFIQREGTRGDLDVDLAVAIELNLLGAPVAGGYYAGLIDTTGDGSIQSNDDYQSGERYALIVSDKSLEGGRGASPASGLPTGDLEWDTQDRGGEAGCFTRWNGLDATNVIIAKNDTSYEVHDFIEAVRSQYPAATTPGGSEWYLPAMDELELLYRNFKPNNADHDTRDFPHNFPGSNPSGKNLSSVPEGFNYENSPRIPDVTYLDLFKEGNAQAIDLDQYWSTTDADEGGLAWYQHLTRSGFEGLQFADRKDFANGSVRPVRRVVLDDSNDTKNRSGNYNINGSITAHGLSTDGGDVSFTEDTGTTPKFFWDASAEALGIGTSSPSNTTTVGIDMDGNQTSLRFSDSAKSTYAELFANNGTLILRADAENAFDNTKMQFEIDGSEAARIESNGDFQFNSGYGSVATAYGCRAWVNFDGTGTVSIRQSGNVSSITDNATGDYIVNFTTAMPDGGYAAITGFQRFGTDDFLQVVDSLQTTSSTRVQGFSSGSVSDFDYVGVSVFR